MLHHPRILYCAFPTNKHICLHNHNAPMKIRSLTLYITTIYSSKPNQVSPVVLILSFRAKGYSLESPVAYSCHASLVSFSWEQQHDHFLIFNDLDILKITDQLFYGMYLWNFSSQNSGRELSPNILRGMFYEQINFFQYS